MTVTATTPAASLTGSTRIAFLAGARAMVPWLAGVVPFGLTVGVTIRRQRLARAGDDRDGCAGARGARAGPAHQLGERLEATRADVVVLFVDAGRKHSPMRRVPHSMTAELRPLSNDVWGFESSCFVCEPRNAAGLRIPFHHDVDHEQVVATFTLDERFSGAPTYVHGGVLLAILDEAMAWATIAIAEKFAVTNETSSRFERPVKLHREHRVEAWIDRTDGRSIETGARVVRTDGTECVRTRATFAVLGAEQASDAAGTDVASFSDYVV